MVSKFSSFNFLLGLVWIIILLASFVEAFQTECRGVQKRRTQQFSHFRPRALSISLGSLLQEKNPSQASVLDWSFLDGVYLITCPNADPRGERIENTKKVLHDVGLLDITEIKEFETDDDNRIRGCYTSHISVMKDILENASETSAKSKGPLDGLFGSWIPKSGSNLKVSEERDLKVLILEDNVALSGSKLRQATVDSMLSYSKADPDWDVIHLSYIPYVPNLKVLKTNNKDIVKLSCGEGSALGTTAYIINSKAMRKLIQEDQNNGGFVAPIPDVMAKLFPETRYAVDPVPFVRAPGVKSLVNPQLDDLRSVLFLPPVAAFTQRLLIVTGLTTNALLPIVIVVLLLASAISGVVTFDALGNLWTTGSFNGPVFVPLFSASFSVFSLAVLVKGAMLAPKPENASSI